jgi:protoheme IX farnesyltransferase
MSGLPYLMGTLILNIGFLGYAVALVLTKSDALPMPMFRYSIIYLMALFAFLLLDHYLSTALI